MGLAMGFKDKDGRGFHNDKPPTPPHDPANPGLEQEIYDKVSPFPIIVDRVKALITQREAQAYERGRRDATGNLWASFKEQHGDTKHKDLEPWIRSFIIAEAITPEHFEKGKPDGE